MKRDIALAMDAEYLALLAYEEVEAREVAAEIEAERRAFEAHYETNHEHREEMYADDARYGTFAELMEANR